MFGNAIAALENDVWSMKLQLSLEDVIVVYVQGLYAIRLWKLGRHFHKFLPWFVFLAVAASLGIATFIVYEIYVTRNFLSFSTVTVRSIHALFSTIAVGDFVIAFMMCYYLHKSRGDKMFSSTYAIVLRLMRLVLVTGLATSACSLFALVAYIVWPKTLIFLGITFILPKLYVNSLLAMLNYRRKHSSEESTQEPSVGSWIPAVFQIKSHSSRSNIEESNIGIPFSEIQGTHSSEDKLGHSRGTLDCQV